MTDAEYNALTEEQRGIYLAFEIKKKLQELDELYKKSRQRVYSVESDRLLKKK